MWLNIMIVFTKAVKKYMDLTLNQGVRWQKIIEGAILSDDDITDDVTLMEFGKRLRGLKPPCQHNPRF